jgi:hypothetical protein
VSARPHVAGDREPLWVRLGFGLAAAIAEVGDALFVRASPGAGTSLAWTAFLGAYLCLSGVSAATAATGHGPVRTASAGAAAGAAIAFNLLALLSVGVFFLPLTIWVIAAARRASRDSGGGWPLILVPAGVALLAPFLALVVVHP